MWLYTTGIHLWYLWDQGLMVEDVKKLCASLSSFLSHVKRTKNTVLHLMARAAPLRK